MTFTRSSINLAKQMNGSTAISVVICTYNRAASLSVTLESLARMSVPPQLDWELIVVDNNSTDNTRAVVTEFHRVSDLSIRYLFEPQQGLCHARNRGVAAAIGEIIAFTDDDVQVEPAWLRELADTFTKFNCMGVAGKSVPAWNGLAKPAWFATTGPYCLSRGTILDFDLGKDSKEIEIAPWGLNMAFRKAAFEKYGTFRSDLGVSGSAGLLGEDTEFGRRLLRSGEKIAYTPRAVVFHPVDPRRITKSYFLRYHLRLGRTDIRLQGWPAGSVLYFGIPRYMFRSLVERCENWLFSSGVQKRLYFKAQVYFLVGQMIEARVVQRELMDRRDSSSQCSYAGGAKLNDGSTWGSRDAH
jgi:glycosyltransferase involved in cell wall biosynthesis